MKGCLGWTCESPLEESAAHTGKCVAVAAEFLKEGYGAGGTSYNNNV
jgi:hypothetical protein